MRWPFGKKTEPKKTDLETSESEPEVEAAEAPKAAIAENPERRDPPKGGWLSRLAQGLSKSSSRLTQGLGSLFGGGALDEDRLEALEELLIAADLSVPVASQITSNLAKTRFGKEVSETEIREALAEEIAVLLRPVAQPLTLKQTEGPQTLLFVGVNGSGKTTTIGKLAQTFVEAGHRPLMAAGDTFRAAAAAQLKIWGDRTGTPVVTGAEGCDPAGLAFDAMQTARQGDHDLVLIDTAGRLHNRQELMDELAKVVRVIKKQNASAPHHVILVLDATIGQNALSQVKAFADLVQVTGLVVTKLDGTAKGGVVVALAKEFGLPVHCLGVGEGADDLRPFAAQDFARALVGLETNPSGS